MRASNSLLALFFYDGGLPVKNYRYLERRRQTFRRIGFWFAEILICIFLALIAAQFCVQTVTIRGDSMQPAYRDGDTVIVNKLKYRISNPARYDVVLIELEAGTSTHYIVKRVLGLPGETIQIVDGKVLINGEEIKTEFSEEILSAGLAAYSIELGEDEYFVMGDNCNNSEDSRVANIGNITRKQIKGRISH